MSKRSWMKVVEDFGGYSGYMDHAKGVPVDENGEVLEMEGDLKELFRFHYDSKFQPSLTMSEREHRQQLTVFVHFHPQEHRNWLYCSKVSKSCAEIARINAEQRLARNEVETESEDAVDYPYEPVKMPDPPSDHESDEYCFTRTKNCQSANTTATVVQVANDTTSQTEEETQQLAIEVGSDDEQCEDHTSAEELQQLGSAVLVLSSDAGDDAAKNMMAPDVVMPKSVDKNDCKFE